jgi:hypothetical protein
VTSALRTDERASVRPDPGWRIHSRAAEAGEIWRRVEGLVDRAPDLHALRAHRLHLVAARLWSSRGAALPSGLRDQVLNAGLSAMAAPALLRRAREAYDGGLMVMKGAEAASGYLHPSDRVFRDVDLLAEDAPAAQRALIGAGFAEVGDPAAYLGAQHLAPLVWPGLPLVVEVHRFPNIPPWLPRVSAERVLREAVPSAIGVTGLLAPAAPVHGLLLAAHGWVHSPLGRLGDLVDVAATVSGRDHERAAELAAEWGWEHLWRITSDAVAAILGDAPAPPALKTWARHLTRCRERTVAENHIARLAAPAFGVGADRAPSAVAGAVRHAATPYQNEPWSSKLRRTRAAVAHPFMTHSAHDRAVASDS